MVVFCPPREPISLNPVFKSHIKLFDWNEILVASINQGTVNTLFNIAKRSYPCQDGLEVALRAWRIPRSLYAMIG